jgi:endonuclease YncB( thermonuclease family)
VIDSLLVCLVVAITDGDTIKARCGEAGSYELVAVRLAEIDAPERRQAFGNRSKQALADLCFNQWATIAPTARDRYGRTVARVQCQGEDSSAEQVRSGMAWAFTRYLTDPEIARLEEAARKARVGLWHDASPVAPWKWRKAHYTPSIAQPFR